MGLQDVIAVVYLLTVTLIIARGVTGPRHKETHWGILAAGLFTPFIAFDLDKLGDVPVEAWAYCAFFLVCQATNTAYHLLYAKAPHSRGPEVLFQPSLILWTTGLRFTLDESLWFRGDIGVLLFCLQGIFISLAVLMVVYVSEGTSIHDDNFDLFKNELRSRGNAAFLITVPTALLLTLYIVFLHPLFLVGGALAFAGGRFVLPMADREIARKRRADA